MSRVQDRRRRRLQPAWLGLAGLAVLAACDSPTIPARDQPYDFTLATEPALVFHWPVGSTVRLYVSEPAGTRQGLLSEAVVHGMRVWNQAVLYDEYRLEAVASPASAHAVIVWSDDPAPPVLTESCSPAVGRAVTTFCAVEEEELRRLRPFPLSADAGAESPVRFVVTLGTREGEDREQLRRLVAHELGHVLGIFRHAPSNEDLMWGGLLTTDVPSRADRQTIQVLYHTAPDLRP
ncbi:MAG TPA: hypothetical protein VMK65_07600 [Longimicrobiales bacterium]|nr:hypothetical protein [Longimicrobiales bacterium]